MAINNENNNSSISIDELRDFLTGNNPRSSISRNDGFIRNNNNNGPLAGLSGDPKALISFMRSIENANTYLEALGDKLEGMDESSEAFQKTLEEINRTAEAISDAESKLSHDDYERWERVTNYLDQEAELQQRKTQQYKEEIEALKIANAEIKANDKLSAAQKRREIEANNRHLVSLERQRRELERGEQTFAEYRSRGGTLAGQLFNVSQTSRQASADYSAEENNKGIVDRFTDAANKIVDSLNGIRTSMTNAINKAASELSHYYGLIDSNLEGTGVRFADIAEKAVSNMGIGTLVKQTDYLNNIASLTSAGLNYSVEERALLETIKNKTLHTFEANNSALNRLIRLKQQDLVSSQFGLELALKNALNGAFADTSYLNNLFDSVSSAIVDASAANQGDITTFNSTVQTWLGYMYESGLSEGVVSKIASGINALGSGNVNALASDADVQRLFLLSMDRIGMDYADTLQTGLSSSDTNALMKSIVSYLAEISDNTSDNLVLQSSYSNLFSMTTSDIKAIKNLSQIDVTGIVDSSTAIKNTQTAISNLSSRTLASEMINNAFENAQYTFGQEIAGDTGKYIAYKAADVLYNIFNDFSDAGGVVGNIAKVGKTVAAATQFGIGATGLISVIKSIDSLTDSTGALQSMIVNRVGGTGGLNGVSSQAAFVTSDTSSSGPFANTSANFKTVADNGFTEMEQTYGKADTWGNAEEDESLAILKKLEAAIIGNKSGDHNAIAVSLEGMNDEVLKSFASIFADEDAMLSTFTGDNTVITDNMFKFTDDRTSSTTAKEKTKSI